MLFETISDHLAAVATERDPPIWRAAFQAAVATERDPPGLFCAVATERDPPGGRNAIATGR